ncbi:hypothetical protein BV25DRAFT_1843098 [Artomyces pyxidatus]|uniref:Uncharacterized protein n=1 Tax=Artomyces pyxidatus TaxID=48021 RepID=A0ACB8SG64_9AGAM|nr:hypothetical protein BV25DRAFT_1843098 [Artomyces pyxidatus]
MSTLSLPSYTPDHNHSPAYSTESQQYERRLLVPPRQRLSAEFVKQSRSSGLSLRLAAQVDGVTTPVYASREPVEGTVKIAKPDGLACVAVKRNCKCVGPATCPSSLLFSAPLPTTFADEKTTYSLPPTYEAHLTGLPGFTANVDYRSAVSPATLLPHVPSRSGQALGKPCTRIQSLRQSIVNMKVMVWTLEWLTFAGELKVNPEVTIDGFKAGGLWVKENCVVLTIMPPDALKGPIGDMRLVVPIRLVTHPWTAKAYVEHVSPAPSEHETYELSELAYLASCTPLAGTDGSRRAD